MTCPFAFCFSCSISVEQLTVSLGDSKEIQLPDNEVTLRAFILPEEKTGYLFLHLFQVAGFCVFYDTSQRIQLSLVLTLSFLLSGCKNFLCWPQTWKINQTYAVDTCFCLISIKSFLVTDVSLKVYKKNKPGSYGKNVEEKHSSPFWRIKHQNWVIVCIDFTNAVHSFCLNIQLPFSQVPDYQI